MRQSWAGMLAAVVLTGQVSLADAHPDWRWLVVCDGPDQEAERTAIVQALRLLPRLPVRVAVIDATRAKPDVQANLLRLDAFVIRGSPVIYIVRQSALLRGAVAGSDIYVHALASVVWHEMAHVNGSDERDARKQEQALWTSFVRDQRVDEVAALRYLAALDRRPHDPVVALR
jgi:hypothetical protein